MLPAGGQVKERTVIKRPFPQLFQKYFSKNTTKYISTSGGENSDKTTLPSIPQLCTGRAWSSDETGAGNGERKELLHISQRKWARGDQNNLMVNGSLIICSNSSLWLQMRCQQSILISHLVISFLSQIITPNSAPAVVSCQLNIYLFCSLVCLL